MVRTKFGLEYLDRPPKERLGLVILALVPEAAWRDCCTWSQRRDDPCREPFRRSRWPADRAARPRHTCPGLKQKGEIAVADCNGGMILAESLFVDLDGPPIERLGLGILALVSKQPRRDCCNDRNVGMILAENPFVDLDAPAERAARPRHTCPGPEADGRDCCNALATSG